MEKLSQATGNDRQRCVPSTLRINPLQPHPNACLPARVCTPISQLCDRLCPQCTCYQRHHPRQHWVPPAPHPHRRHPSRCIRPTAAWDQHTHKRRRPHDRRALTWNWSGGSEKTLFVAHAPMRVVAEPVRFGILWRAHVRRWLDFCAPFVGTHPSDRGQLSAPSSSDEHL